MQDNYSSDDTHAQGGTSIQAENLDTLNPPTIAEPSFVPPVAQPPIDGLLPPDPWAPPAAPTTAARVHPQSGPIAGYSPLLDPPSVTYPTHTAPPVEPQGVTAYAAPSLPPVFPASAKQVLTKARVLSAVALTLILAFGIGAVVEGAGKGRAEKQLADTSEKLSRANSVLATTDADLKKSKAEADSLRVRVSEVQSEKNDLADRNSTLAEFGAQVSSLVDDLDACVDGHKQFISDLADGNYWSSGRISNLVSQCGEAQDQAAALNDALTTS